MRGEHELRTPDATPSWIRRSNWSCPWNDNADSGSSIRYRPGCKNLDSIRDRNDWSCERSCNAGNRLAMRVVESLSDAMWSGHPETLRPQEPAPPRPLPPSQFQVAVQVSMRRERLEAQVAPAALGVVAGRHGERLDRRRRARTVVADQHGHGAEGQVQARPRRQPIRVRVRRAPGPQPHRPQERRRAWPTHHAEPRRHPPRPLRRCAADRRVMIGRDIFSGSSRRVHDLRGRLLRRWRAWIDVFGLRAASSGCWCPSPCSA